MEEKVFREILKRQEMYFRNLELSKLQEQEEEQKQKEADQESIKEEEQESTDEPSNKKVKKK